VTGQDESPAVVAEFSVFNLCSDIPETVNFVATYQAVALDANADSGTFQQRFRLNIKAHGLGELSGNHYNFYAQRWAFIYFPTDQPTFEQLVEIGGVALGHGRVGGFPVNGVLHFNMTPEGIDLLFEPSADVECAAVYPAQPRF